MDALTQEWRDILVYGEAQGAQPHPAAYEALGKARELADRLGARVLCAWPGNEEEGQALVHRGADELLLLEGNPTSPRVIAATLKAIAAERRPEIVLLAGTPLGQELAGRLAASLDAGVVGQCVDLDLDEGARLLVAKRASFGGAVQETWTIPEARPQIATLRPGAGRAPWPDDGRYGRVSTVPVTAAPMLGTRMIRTEAAKAGPSWRGAERLVVGGALLDKDGFADLQALAQKLGASWAATRLAVQQGLAPEERGLRPWDEFQAPKLCVAAGIEDPFEFALALPAPKQLVLLGEGPLERVASHVVPGPAGPALKALAAQLR